MCECEVGSGGYGHTVVCVEVKEEIMAAETLMVRVEGNKAALTVDILWVCSTVKGNGA